MECPGLFVVNRSRANINRFRDIFKKQRTNTDDNEIIIYYGLIYRIDKIYKCLSSFRILPEGDHRTHIFPVTIIHD